MMRKPPRFTHGYIDRHGKPRWYLRRRGLKNVPLPGLPWSPEFMAAYEAALAGQAPRPEIGASRTKPGSVSALVVKFYRSAEWAGLASSTQVTYGRILERFRAEYGDKPVASLQREHVRAILAKKAATPQAANNLRKLIRLLMRFAVEEGSRRDDPTMGVAAIRTRSDGFHTWTEDEIATFEDQWPIGTKQRLAMALALYTGQRRSDLVQMGRQHVRNGRIQVTQQKTRAKLVIPLHPELQAVLDATPSEHLTYLTTAFGQPFTPAGFGGWFRAACDAAGLPKGCSVHGLRKAACRRLAEAGCSANVIAAISGHRTLKEVARYTTAADQERLADTAIRALSGPEREQEEANREDGLAKKARNTLK
jgi:integrase